MTTRSQWPSQRNDAGTKLRRKRREDEEATPGGEEKTSPRGGGETSLGRSKEKCLREEQEAEAEHKKVRGGQRQREEAQRKAAEANKKRQREEFGAFRESRCSLRVHQRWLQEANCVRTGARHRGRSASGRRCTRPGLEKEGQGQGSPDVASQGEKKKRVCKAKAKDDDEVEIVGESRSGAGPSWVSLDRLGWCQSKENERPDGGVGAGIEEGQEGLRDLCGTRLPFVARRRSPRKSRLRKEVDRG
ncbi:hypothetical protein BU15DRAFT_68901 [Melanogaster broomeanus]|nr:hypothetical protein BU15DRAFT_68901 [Melanogaster broomeanus]